MLKNSAVALKYGDEEGTPSRLFAPDILLPSQYFSVVQGGGGLTPEKKLMLAVLESALQDFQRYRLASGVRRKRLFREAQEWLTSQERTGTMSFVVICQALGIDPDYIRQKLFV
jgi:hypothetical protein